MRFIFHCIYWYCTFRKYIYIFFKEHDFNLLKSYQSCCLISGTMFFILLYLMICFFISGYCFFQISASIWGILVLKWAFKVIHQDGRWCVSKANHKEYYFMAVLYMWYKVFRKYVYTVTVLKKTSLCKVTMHWLAFNFHSFFCAMCFPFS